MLPTDQSKGVSALSDLPLLDPADEPVPPGTAGFITLPGPVPEDADEPAPRRVPTRWILIGALAGVLVVVAGGLIGWRVLSGSDTKLTTPDTIAGLRHDTNGDALDTANYMRDAIVANASLGNGVGAVYADPAGQGRDVLFFGGTGSVHSPSDALNGAFGLLNDQTGSVSGIHPVAEGPLGGVMRCGTSNGDGSPIAVCGWADGGSLALAMFPSRSVDEAAGLMLQLRTATEHRG
jgi:hypothetical protein